jgi:hypothetical protein
MRVIALLALVWVLAIYAIAELALSAIKKKPLWLLRQFLVPARRLLWDELSYLRALIKDPDLNRWAHEYATLQAIKARPVKERAEPKPLLGLLQSYVEQGQQVVVVGEPGAGKTTILEALTYELALRAYRWQVLALGMFLGLILLILITSLSPLPALLLLTMPLFEFIFRRWPLPVFIQLRCSEGDSVENLLKGTVSGCTGGGALSKALRNYVERGRLVWLLDGMDEVRGGATNVLWMDGVSA